METEKSVRISETTYKLIRKLIRLEGRTIKGLVELLVLKYSKEKKK